MKTRTQTFGFRIWGLAACPAVERKALWSLFGTNLDQAQASLDE